MKLATGILQVESCDVALIKGAKGVFKALLEQDPSLNGLNRQVRVLGHKRTHSLHSSRLGTVQ